MWCIELWLGNHKHYWNKEQAVNWTEMQLWWSLKWYHQTSHDNVSRENMPTSMTNVVFWSLHPPFTKNWTFHSQSVCVPYLQAWEPQLFCSKLLHHLEMMREKGDTDSNSCLKQKNVMKRAIFKLENNLGRNYCAASAINGVFMISINVMDT